MKIDSIQAVFPSRIVTNNDVLYEIEKHSKPHYEGNLSEALDKISGWLNFSGAQNRRWLSPEEAPIRCIKKAINQALEEANCDKSDVELLIYTGIGKGFLEPGQSYMVAKAMGMDHVICFDILDACMSWTRALHIAHSLLRSGQYAKIMIVNGEFNHFQDGPLFPHNFCLKGYEQLYWTFPSVVR